jgi:hypothetical protein
MYDPMDIVDVIILLVPHGSQRGFDDRFSNLFFIKKIISSKSSVQMHERTYFLFVLLCAGVSDSCDWTFSLCLSDLLATSQTNSLSL